MGGIARMGLAWAGLGARRRRCKDSGDDKQRRDAPQPPSAPEGYGGTGSSSVLALLDNVQTLPASRRLVSDPAEPVTRPHLLLGQAPIRDRSSGSHRGDSRPLT